MPTRLAGPCKHPGCPGRAVTRGYCTAHRHEADTRPSAHRRGYGGAEWARTRMGVIRRDGLCCFCGGDLLDYDGTVLPGTTVHHLVKRRDGGTDEPDNLAACHSRCHSRHHARGKR